ncbi:uncharacterized protein YjbI with pentapeptide repeats [Streptomyces canus]|nr:uncharacterized protein YjbI with pentapeptide repeats [Streptomyces canus]
MRKNRGFRYVRLLLMSIVLTALLAGALLLLWRGPWLVDGEYLSRKDLQSGSAALVTGFRTAVVQFLAVLGASVALIYTAFTYRLTRRGQVTDRFTKALERLGSDEPYVRIGGVLALEQIIHDSPTQANHAAQVLASFLRKHAPHRIDAARPISDSRWAPHLRKASPSVPDSDRGGRLRDSRSERIIAARKAARRGDTAPGVTPKLLPDYPADDVQQALTGLTDAVCRHHTDPSVQVNLSRLHLAGVDLGQADLTGLHLWGTNLTGAYMERAKCLETRMGAADLMNANLRHADLRKAILRSADLSNADLRYVKAEKSDFFNAVLQGARLCHAQLKNTKLGADLSGADLTGADLTSAHLDLADLTDTNLISVTFSEADLEGAILTGAYLNEANLATARVNATQIVSARPTRSTKLPPAIASDPTVIARITEIEDEMERIFGTKDVAKSSRLTSLFYEARRVI